MSLPDQYPRVMDALRKTSLEHLSLQPPLQEILEFQRKHVIKPHPVLVEHTNTD